MDRFVTRTPTWKTLSYSSIAAQPVLQKKIITKKTAVDNKKKPLQQKQFGEVAPNHYDFDKRLGDLLPFSQHANAENFNANSNDSGLSSSSSISPQCVDKRDSNYTKPLTPVKNHLDFPIEKENDAFVAMTHSPKSHKKVTESGLQVERTFQGKIFNPEVNDTPEKPLHKTNNMMMARIQRDLNSPSAAARMKAIRAMKSPTKSAYCQFDIPETEQSLHLPEPPSLQDVMRNIVVYVEVRSGEDNRSAGVRKVIQALGARVCLSLNRETTHVIFKDGRLSTYKKATQMNVPIVSILWIEACKNQRRICDPKEYPISNLDRYENPELYTKMKRVKSMQPDSECNKRIRTKAGGTPKDSTPIQKTGDQKKTSTFIGGTPTSSTNKKKTDISQFFKKLEKPTPSSASKINNGTNVTTEIAESPATILLNRIHSECYTPLNKMKSKSATQKNNNRQNNSANTSQHRDGAKKVLDFVQTEYAEGNTKTNIRSNIVVSIKAKIEASSQLNTHGRTRRHSLMPDSEIETAVYSMNTMAISVSTPNKSNNRRRSSIHTSQDMTLATERSRNTNNTQTILEENNEIEMEPDNPSNSVKRRRTLYTPKTMDETDLIKSKTNKEVETPSKNSTHRRTLCKLVATPPADATIGKLLEETGQCATPLIFSSTRQPGNRRRTIFDVSMDIITQRLQCINQSARRSLAPPTPSAEMDNTLEKPINTPMHIKKSNDLLNSTTTPQSSIESLNECKDNNDVITVSTPETITLKKRRKLFMPNEMLVTPPPAPTDAAKTAFKPLEESHKLITNSSNITTGNSAVKRRRTLMPISQPQLTTNITHKESISNTAAITATVKKRRSTLDFEQVRQIKTKSSSVSSSSATKISNSQQQFKSKKIPTLVYTNMHHQQIDVIREAIDKMRFFLLESSVTNTTTHLVSLEPRRTLNLLKALARGLWVLDYSWITDSLKAGSWLPEEFYELQDFSRAIEICRSERQAFGNSYKCDLFRKIGAFFISSNCCPVSKENMRELITLCGGQVVYARQKARYIIGDANRTLKDRLYLTPYWVLDSITQMQLMKFNKYMYPLPVERPAPQPPLQLKGNN